jgi:hypothetical protein
MDENSRIYVPQGENAPQYLMTNALSYVASVDETSP